MPSPFPGMDPYLEDPELWPDVHHNLIAVSAEMLQARLRPNHLVRIDERLYEADDPQLIDREAREAYLKVMDRERRVVITRIEFVGPQNKIKGTGAWQSFREACQVPFKAAVHLVVVDLLRGQPSIELPAPRLPSSEYAVFVRRADDPARLLVWQVHLRDRLPAVQIPLQGTIVDPILELQAVLATAYERAGYDLDINYKKEPEPPLSPEHTAWADQLLRSKGLR